jgi:ferredoxin
MKGNKKLNYLKGLRVLLAILVFVPVLLYFMDFRHQMPVGVGKALLFQIIPALMAGMVSVWIVQFVLVLLFGRIYCSVICPAGVLQDVINRLWGIGKKKKKRVFRFKYHKPYNILRYGLMALTFGCALAGISLLCLVLDPYSNFGRMASSLFRPVAVWGNNLLAGGLAKFDNYTLYHVSLTTVTTASLIAAGAALALLVTMVAMRGRLFCNTLCPTGALLSLVSRFSLFRISIDKEKCISCGLCAKACKAEAIDTENFKVDNSRCVDCFNCISVCNKDSIRYSPVRFPRKGDVPSPSEKTGGTSRRTFLATGATLAATLPAFSALAQENRGDGEKSPITPPGSHDLERFKEKCTACHVCVVQCPSHVLRPAGLQFGLGYMLKPHMAYIDSYCNYECTVCADVCPNHAIALHGTEEKTTTQVGIAEFSINRCIVETENTDCGACSEHCPTQAVHMVPYKDGSTLTVPHVEPDLCVGCGGCESICPVRPRRAIIIKANTVHQHVEKPAEEKVLDIKVDDFGF